MKIGFLAGSFDVVHPGYIKMFEEAKKNCDHLIVGLHEDPGKENEKKLKLILNIEDRYLILSAIKYIDNIIIYKTELDLLYILESYKIDVRFLGDDYKNKSFTGDFLSIPIYYINRDHGWSTTKYKTLIFEHLKFNENKSNNI